MREQGRICGIVERFLHYSKFVKGPNFPNSIGIRKDLFGFIDIVAIDPVVGIIGVQSCGQAFNEHVKKMTEERNEEMFEWLKWAKVELWGWRKVKLKRGSKAMRWKPRIADFWLENNDIIYKER